MRFIFWLLGSEVDEIAVVNQFANERVDLPQGKLWGTFEIATNEAEFMHAHFQSNRARIFDRGGAELLGQGEDAEDAANPRFSELVINKVAECADVSTGTAGAPQ
jgi:hypothetical protein